MSFYREQVISESGRLGDGELLLTSSGVLGGAASASPSDLACLGLLLGFWKIKSG